MNAAEPAPIEVGFPLRGEWTALNTPAERVPSHGTDQLGQRYAYDFIRIDRARPGWSFHRRSTLRALTLGVPLADCHGWSAPIVAPFDGTVAAAQDGEAERDPVHFMRDLAVLWRHARSFQPGVTALRSVLGNHVILRRADAEVYAVFAHARCGSIRVAPGELVRQGQGLAAVGHSGNSTAPHLHFQLMDGPDILTARGLPCCFSAYEAWRGEAWVPVRGGLPGMREFVRCEAADAAAAA